MTDIIELTKKSLNKPRRGKYSIEKCYDIGDWPALSEITIEDERGWFNLSSVNLTIYFDREDTSFDHQFGTKHRHAFDYQSHEIEAWFYDRDGGEHQFELSEADLASVIGDLDSIFADSEIELYERESS